MQKLPSLLLILSCAAPEPVPVAPPPTPTAPQVAAAPRCQPARPARTRPIDATTLRAQLGHRWPGPTPDPVYSGMYVRFRAQEVHLIHLIGRVRSWASYTAELPEGLRFDMERKDVLEQLGPPDDSYCSEDCTYRALGLIITYRPNNCIAMVTLRPRLGPNQIRVERFRLTQANIGGSHGLLYSLRTEHHPNLIPTIDLLLHLPTRTAVHRATFKEGSVFVAFKDLDLPPGPTQVEAELRPSVGTLIDAQTIQTGFEMPRRFQVRARVAEIRVPPGKYDDAVAVAAWSTFGLGLFAAPLIPKKLDRPDLFFTLQLAGERRLTGRTRQDTYRGRWKARTEWLWVAEKDQMSIAVWDKDAVGDDHLGTLKLPVEEMRTRTHKFDRIRRLRLIVDRRQRDR